MAAGRRGVYQSRVTSRLHLARIEKAMRTIDPVFLNTPQFRAESLESVLGCRLLAKIEVLNPIRSFKGRGASFFVSELPADTALVCASAGNFGQAMAYACRSRGIPLTVFAGLTANPLKVTRMRSFGAKVQLAGNDFDAAKLAARSFARETGSRFVEDSLEPATGEGAGTVGLELLRWPEPLNTVLVSLGNGALLTGIARWVKAQSPTTNIIGVCAAGAPAMAESWRKGTVVTYPAMDTIADGIAVRIPIREVLADMRGFVDDVVLVSDDAIVRAMKLLHEHLGLIVEPSGAAGIAALLTWPERFRGQFVSSILCGGNLTPEQAREWL
jgi:threonine dehydratase